MLNWDPIARRLGTPAETNQWNDRYDGIWGGRNIFRFRSPYEDTRRCPGVRRVIALGDSFTWRSKIASSDSTWPALLERIMAHAPNARPTEVINMAHGCYATGNEAEELRRKSAILELLEHALTARFYSAVDLNRKYYAPGSPAWRDAQRGFREMGDSASRYCTPILLVLYPYLFPGRWTLETYPERDIHRLVADVGRRAGFEVPDLLPAFVAAGRDFEDWWGTAYDSHPGGAAQALTAMAIAGYLEEHRLLPDSSGGAGRCGP